MAMDKLTIRIDETTKKNVQKIFASMGMDLTAGINLYLKQVERTKTIPFPIATDVDLLEHKE